MDNGFRYDISKETNPDFLAGFAWFAVSHAERVFVYEGLANGTTGIPDYNSVAPFFLNETFPKDWYRRGVAFPLASALADAAELFVMNPRALGGNEGLGNFIPLSTNISSQTPQQLGCFILENILDVAPDQLDPVIYNNFELYTDFIKGDFTPLPFHNQGICLTHKNLGVMAPFFINDGYFNCNAALNFVKPGESAGSEDGSVSSSGSPVSTSLFPSQCSIQCHETKLTNVKVNGAYPGIGVIAPNTEPS